MDHNLFGDELIHDNIQYSSRLLAAMRAAESCKHPASPLVSQIINATYDS